MPDGPRTLADVQAYFARKLEESAHPAQCGCQVCAGARAWQQADAPAVILPARPNKQRRQPIGAMAWKRVSLVLPYPPSVNHYYPTARGRRILSQAGREYRKLVAEAVSEQWQADVEKPLLGRLEMWMHLRPPSTQASDIDNRIKALWDALQHAGVYRNDNQVDALHLFRDRMTSGGSVVVEIGPY